MHLSGVAAVVPSVRGDADVQRLQRRRLRRRGGRPASGEPTMTSMPPLPDIPIGTVLELERGEWQFGNYHLRLLVEEVRADISALYRNEWVAVHGQRLAADGTPMGRVDALVRADVLRRT
ncbi:MAG: hypothetical protein DIU79_05835 [Actinobacteria bacterium]|nr:MAG: hypothetical protein DIU79_05835 [Actinomycetota bacterium]